MNEGRVLKTYNSFYYVAAQGTIFTCKVKGRMKQSRFTLCTGDLVAFEPVRGQEGMITAVLPRKNLLTRPTVANLDFIVLTMAAADPDFSPLILDKLLVRAALARVPALIVLNKTDLPGVEDVARKVTDLYSAIGYEVYPISASTGAGIAGLRERLKGHITALGGPSGVGKSSTLNALQPDFQRETGQVSAKIGRGRHTTRFAELVPFNEGYLADTPGFGNVNMEDVPGEQLAEAFVEFAAFTGACKYHPCSHLHEPVCGVKQAVAEGKIAPSRYESYQLIAKEIAGVRKVY